MNPHHLLTLGAERARELIGVGRIRVSLRRIAPQCVWLHGKFPEGNLIDLSANPYRKIHFGMITEFDGTWKAVHL